VKAYLGKDAPKFRSAMPTYFPAELKWKDATGIVLDNNAKDDADITLLKAQDIQGKGVVTGHIRVGALKKEGDPIEDIAVLLLSETGGPVSFDITNANGEYKIENIPNGKYEIYAEVAGMETFSKWIEITDDVFTFSEVNFSVQSTNIVTSIEDIPASVENISLYPNPAKDVLTMRLNSMNAQRVKVNIVDMNGKVVSTQDNMLSVGTHTLRFNVANLKAGSYTVTVQDAKGQIVQANFIRVE
jgi:hypothetical protein